MDPVAHTLFGACLGEAGLKKASRYTMPVLLLGANAPDVDVVASFAGTDAMYDFRRGWTHGVVATALWPWLLIGVFALFHRVRQRSHPEPAPSWIRLFAVAQLAVLSHPLLDWLNNYGVRLLMPFDDAWFYGDALFIIDPWMWLCLGAAVVLAHSRSRVGMMGWTILALALTGLVVGTPFAPLPAKVLWGVSLIAIVTARAFSSPRLATLKLARMGLGAVVVYAVVMALGSAGARRATAAYAAARGVTVRSVMAGPMAANPFQRDVIIDTGSDYRFLRLDLFADELLVEAHPPLPRGGGPLAEAAAAAPAVQGYVHWLRFPSYAVESQGDGHRVWIRDARYSRTPATIGRAYVDLDARGRPVSTVFRSRRGR